METMKNKRSSTSRQISAVHFCETWLHIKFDGNIDSFDDCHKFLSQYLDDAKWTAMEISCEYEAYMFDRL